MREALDGNLCRCTGYHNIVKSDHGRREPWRGKWEASHERTADRRSIKRKEDYRFLTGAGQYTDDVALPNQAYAAFVRSPHAHAS